MEKWKCRWKYKKKKRRRRFDTCRHRSRWTRLLWKSPFQCWSRRPSVRRWGRNGTAALRTASCSSRPPKSNQVFRDTRWLSLRMGGKIQNDFIVDIKSWKKIFSWQRTSQRSMSADQMWGFATSDFRAKDDPMRYRSPTYHQTKIYFLLGKGGEKSKFTMKAYSAARLVLAGLSRGAQRVQINRCHLKKKKRWNNQNHLDKNFHFFFLAYHKAAIVRYPRAWLMRAPAISFSSVVKWYGNQYMSI